MKKIKLVILPLVLSSLLGGCAVYAPPPAYSQGPYYQTDPMYTQPMYVAPQPVYVQPPISFGFNFGYWGGGSHWRGGGHGGGGYRR